MKLRLVALLALVLFILSSTVFQSFRILETLPNFCIIMSIVYLALYSERHAYTFVAVFGLLQDVFLGRIFGMNLIAYLLMLYAISKIIGVLFKANYMTPLFLLILSTGIYHIVFYVIAFFFQITIPIQILIGRVAVEIILNTLIGTFIYARVFKAINGYRLGDYHA